MHCSRPIPFECPTGWRDWPLATGYRVLGGWVVPSSTLDQIADSERALDREVDDIAGSRKVLVDGRARSLSMEAQVERPVLVHDIAETDRCSTPLGEKLRSLIDEVGEELEHILGSDRSPL